MKTPRLVQQKRDGIYFILSYENGKRKRKSLGTTDKRKAGLKFSLLTGMPVPSDDVPTISAGTIPPPPQPSPTISFAKAVNEFIKFKYGIVNTWTTKSKASCNNPAHMSTYILKRLSKFSRINTVDEVTYNVLQGFIASLRNGGTMLDRTINKHIGRLRAFFKYCVNMQYVQINEADKLETYKCKTPVRYSFSKDEIKMILENCKDRFKPFFELMLETGLRPCDMWNLSRENFKDKNFIHIVQEKTGDELYVPISKRAQEIVAALPHRLFPWADRKWSREHGEMDQRVETRNELRICFAGDREDGCIRRGQQICKKNNIRLHTFRHTFAMWKLADGCPLEVIKDLMGHKSVIMAELYASQMPKSALAKWV